MQKTMYLKATSSPFSNVGVVDSNKQFTIFVNNKALPDPSFASINTLELQVGVTTMDLTFPVWTTSASANIQNYHIDNDNNYPNGLIPPAGVALKASCTSPCNTLTFTTTFVVSYTYFIWVSTDLPAADVYSV